MLYELAVSVGAVVTVNQTVTSVGVDPKTGAGRVVLAGGAVLTGDLVIGADGANSLVRRAVTGEEDAVEGEASVFTCVPLTSPSTCACSQNLFDQDDDTNRVDENGP